MGAWGVRPFENDDAADFLSELMDVPASERTQLLLAALTLPGGYLEAPQASVAVAAAALVAAHNGMPVTEPVVENPPHPGGVPDGQLRVQASAALSRVNSEESEWHDLWEEAGMLTEAATVLETIRQYL